MICDIAFPQSLTDAGYAAWFAETIEELAILQSAHPGRTYKIDVRRPDDDPAIQAQFVFVVGPKA